MGSQSFQTYRGTRDFFPDLMRRQNYLFSVWRKVCTRFGYEEYLGPLLEPKELYTVKNASGDELANKQLYAFTDLGGREVAIRPEMTPTVARMVAENYQALPKPIRWFSIANFMRYERPQKGRIREFFQLNADIFGEGSVAADAESIELAIAIMREFGATEKMFTIKINNRKWFMAYLAKLLNGTDNLPAVMRIVDRMDKSTPEETKSDLISLGLATEQAMQIVKLGELTLTDVRSNEEELAGSGELLELFAILEKRGLSNFVQFSATTVRGLDYYTGNIFEQYDLHPDNRRSMFGGGRYDELVGVYSNLNVPAVGFAPGDVTTSIFLDNWSLWPKELDRAEVQVLVTVFDEGLRMNAWGVANELRSEGIATELYLPTGDSVSTQLSYANKKQIPWAVILGSDEAQNNTVTLKNLIDGSQETITADKLVERLKDYAN